MYNFNENSYMSRVEGSCNSKRGINRNRNPSEVVLNDIEETQRMMTYNNDLVFLEDPNCRRVIDRYNLKRQKCLFTSKNNSQNSPRSPTPDINLIHENTIDEEIPHNISQTIHHYQVPQFQSSQPILKHIEPYSPIYSPRNNIAMENNYHDVINHHQTFNENIENYVKIPKSIGLQNGIVQIILKHNIRIDLAIDQSIRVLNSNCDIQIALSGNNGGCVSLIHPNGRLYQNGSQVDIMAYDGMNKNKFIRYAKIWHKGISFTGENCVLIYLVDAAGTRTTTDKIMDLTQDIISMVFYPKSFRNNNNASAVALSIVQESNIWMTHDNIECIDIYGYRITQSIDGLVKIVKKNDKCLIRTSPNNGSVTITTPMIHCTASLGQTSHLFVRRGDRRMHFDGSSFIVRNAGHSAGFDDKNFLRVY